MNRSKDAAKAPHVARVRVDSSPGAPRRRELHRRASVALALSLFIAAMITVSCSVETGQPAPEYRSSGLLFRQGDDLAWADPSHWVGANAVATRPQEPGNWWLSATITLDRDLRSDDDPALRVRVPGAIEVFWDGQRIGADGEIGSDRESERPGRHGVWMALDPRLTSSGAHVVVVRVSSHRLLRMHGPINLQVVNRAVYERSLLRRTSFFLFCAGLLLCSAVVIELLHRSIGARADTRWFATLTALVGVLLVLEYARFVYPYPYHWHFLRLIAISALTLAVGVLLPVFVALHLRTASSRFVAVGALAMLLVFVALIPLFPDPDAHSLYILRLSVGVTVLLALLGALRARKGAGWILTAAAANLPPIALTGQRYADHWFFVGFLAMVGVLFMRVIARLRKRARESELALLRTERLRNELLRKTIQPHFLMNSLAVAISQIEDAPARGVALLRDLASELELFLAIGDRESVELREELELCTRHVATMSHLLDRTLSLDLHVSAAAAGSELPPGVLLTLIENAITHGDYSAASHITVRASYEDSGLVIEVANPSAPRETVSDGTGLRFVRSQLERQPYGQWAVSYRFVVDHWLVRLQRAPHNRREEPSFGVGS